ncbi:HCP-like protein [Lactarius deliciosus]|nr:HCP-like protein [Lactarius deliciosus]
MSSIPPPPQPEYRPSPPHLEEPLLAPRPHKITPDLPAEMARTLDSQVARDLSNPQPPGIIHHSASFLSGLPTLLPVSLLPLCPPHLHHFLHQPTLGVPGRCPSLVHHLQASAFKCLHRLPIRPNSPKCIKQNILLCSLCPTLDPLLPQIPSPSAMGSLSVSKASEPPSLTAPLPTISSLIAALPSVQTPNNTPASKIAWCRDVIGLVDRLYVIPNQTGSADPAPGPIHVADQELNRLVEIAPSIYAPSSNPLVPTPSLYHKTQGRRFVTTNGPARAGFSAAWFKLGRDYENFGDFPHAKDCYERGIRNNNESCLYRMGMAHLVGQLGLPPSPETALPLLQRAATVATVDSPQPAYVFGLLLLGEFSHATVPPHLFTPGIPPGSSRDNEARRHLERAAYLNFAPAQYKLGHAYDQQGEIEADMALSKWFLCGSEGAFDKDESLAFTFAEKAARKGLPSAEFAMGYYVEVGVGGPKDIEAARRWYERASQHGNTEATERLAALSQPAPVALSRQEHDNLTETTLAGRIASKSSRTSARTRSLTVPNPGFPSPPVPPPTRSDIPPAAGLPSVNEGYPPYRQSSAGPGPNPNSEGYPPPQRQPPPPQGPPSGPSGASGFPTFVLAPSRERPRRPGRIPIAAPAGYSKQYGQIARPPSVGTGPGGPGRRPPRTGSGSGFGPPGGGPPPQQASGSAPTPPGVYDAPMKPPPPKGPATFQEMGFQSQKLQEKDCIIM